MTLRAIHDFLWPRWWGGPLDGRRAPWRRRVYYVSMRGDVSLTCFLHTTAGDYKWNARRHRFEWREWWAAAPTLPRIPYSAFSDPRDA